MGDGKLRRAAAWIGLLTLAALLLTGCGEGLGLTPTPAQSARTYPVDIVFKEFYQTLGGQQILGPAISILENRNNLKCQFTERVLMCFDSTATDVSRFGLYPLGNELKIKEEPRLSSETVSANARIVDGFTIYEKFLPLYDQLYGARYVGRPLTGLRINQDMRRAEQFFENVGFYQDLNDPNGPVYLIPYGAYLCGADCSYRLNEYWSIVKSNLVDEPFAATVARLGGTVVFGSPLLKARTVEADGTVEQVYANAIFYAPADDFSQVHLRPLPLMMGMTEEQPVEKKIHDQLVFYEVRDGLGHNVPKQFDQFIAMHGGREVAGNPISEVTLISESNLYRQCFENYCLVYDPAASESMRTRMEALGKRYVDSVPQPDAIKISNPFSPEHVSLVSSASRPTLNDNEEQVIQINVFQIDTNTPMDRVEATLSLSLPDRPAVRFFLPPTDENGMSSVTIPPQEGVANGTRIAYRVCLNLPTPEDQPICSQDSYLIWNVQQ